MVDQKLSYNELMDIYRLQEEYYQKLLREETARAMGRQFPTPWPSVPSLYDRLYRQAPQLLDTFDDIDKQNELIKRKGYPAIRVPPFPYQGLL